MVRRFLAAVALGAILALSPPQLVNARTHAPAGQSQLTQFQTEVEAQAHCPRDVVVWLNTSSGIYHEKGMRWYGRTKLGAYVCKREADAAGDRDTRNGQ